MKLEVGMYVRYEKGKITYVSQLLEVIHNYEEFDVYRTDSEYFDYEEKDYFDIVYPDEIIGKPSYNIIDLIGKGDYVNDYKILDMVDVKDSNEKAFTIFQHKGTDTIYFYSNEDIKSIVTKEQFESIQYVIKKERK